MAEYGLYKNSEGYADPTAYEAIRGMAKPGEIWVYKDREILIVKNQGSYCNVLQLGSYKKGCIDINGRYAQPGMISYAFNNLLTERVETLSDDKINTILQEVADALELRVTKNWDNAAGLQQRLFVPLEAEKEKIEFIDPAKDAEIAALKATNEMLQSMYNDLLAKVIAKVGA